MKIVGITDTVTTCDCCGRKGLKKTVVLSNGDNAKLYYGTGCAAMALHGYSDASLNNRIRKEAITAQSYAEQRAKDIERKVAGAKIALNLMGAGEGINHPDILSQHAIWRNCTSNPLKPNPALPTIGFKKWLEERAAMSPAGA